MPRILFGVTNTNNQIESLWNHVQKLSTSEGSHDCWHVFRVWQLAKRLAIAEGAHLETAEVAALCHDLEDWKYTTKPVITPLLDQLGFAAGFVTQVQEICQQISFKGAGVPDSMPSLEGRVVQDADRLDAIGAIGIARAFAYGGSKNRALYTPEESVHLHSSFGEYQNSQSSSLNHFYEKLFLLKDRLHTPSAQALAAARHAYIARFLQEWQSQA
jgi:uncharacterized protein